MTVLRLPLVLLFFMLHAYLLQGIIWHPDTGMYKTWPGLAWPGLSWPVKNIICLCCCEIPPTIKWCFFSNVSYRMESYFSYQWVNPPCIPWLVLTDLNNGLMNCLWCKDWKVFHLAIIIAHINLSVLKCIDCFLFSVIITFNMPIWFHCNSLSKLINLFVSCPTSFHPRLNLLIIVTLA